MAAPIEQCGDYADQIAQFHQQIQLSTDGSGEFLRFFEDKGWKAIGEFDLFKIKAIHREMKIFVKSYSPTTLDYANRVYAALQVLSERQFSKPILPPLALCERTVVFEAGIVERREKYGQVFQGPELIIIEAVLGNHGLLPLSQPMKVDIISVEGQEYIVDPLMDDPFTIFQYTMATSAR